MNNKLKEQIYHITTKAVWDEALSTGVYQDESLKQEGFIHCSYAKQIVGTANLLFNGVNDLLILAINRNKTNCPVIDEDLYNLNEDFPHIYGIVPINAVFDVIPFPCNADGTFSLPKQIR